MIRLVTIAETLAV